MTRRTFMGALAGVGATLFPWRRASAGPVSTTFIVPRQRLEELSLAHLRANSPVKITRTDMLYAEYFGDYRRADGKRATPREFIRGVRGKTYFLAGEANAPMQAFLDGVDVSTRCSEVDLVAGWVRMFDCHTDTLGRTILHPIERIHFGRVEVR